MNKYTKHLTSYCCYTMFIITWWQPVSVQDPFGRSQRLEKLENRRILTKETKEGRTLYYAAVLVSVTLILHSFKTPHTSMSTFCLGPGPLKPTVPQNSPELYQTIGTLHKHCDCMNGITVVLLE